jgi:urease accessory protein
MDALIVFDQHLRGLAHASPAQTGRVVLPFEHRQRARQRTQLESGQPIGIRLPRGTILRGGDWLRATTGELALVVAAPEAVSTVSSRDPVPLARAAYHLGNRHVQVEVGAGWLRYLEDHVLDAMIEALGLPVRHGRYPFEPEAGAYGDHGANLGGRAQSSSHGHRDVRGHGHDHGLGQVRRHRPHLHTGEEQEHER